MKLNCFFILPLVVLFVAIEDSNSKISCSSASPPYSSSQSISCYGDGTRGSHPNAASAFAIAANNGGSKDDIRTPPLKSRRRPRPQRQRPTDGSDDARKSNNRGGGPKRSDKDPLMQEKVTIRTIIPPLGGPIGAPELSVLTTDNPREMEQWIADNQIPRAGNSESSSIVLGFDSETIAKPIWFPERAHLPDGPAMVQLSTLDSCLVVRLSQCGDGSARHAPTVIRELINDANVIKAGVGLDDDALELYRWSLMGAGSDDENVAKGRHQQQQEEDCLDTTWDMKSRFDIGCISPSSDPHRRLGLRQIALEVLGIDLPKNKKLTMSNWGESRLSAAQIAYAARDAWVAAAVCQRLREKNEGLFSSEALLEADFLVNERKLDVMDFRARSRKEAKLKVKKLGEKRREVGNLNEEDESQMKESYRLLDFYRPAHPPTFDEESLQLPFY